MQQMSACGNSKSRRELTSDRGTADLVGRFQDQHRAARPCKIGRANQTVVAGTYDDAIVLRSAGCSRHGRRAVPAHAAFFKSRKTAPAAL